MAIEKKLIHFKKWSDFSSKKLSANEQNTQYTLGVDGALTTGAPDVLYQSVCWIKDVKKMWTHGTLYDCSGGGGITEETDPIFSASPAASITEAKKTEWDNKVPYASKDFLIVGADGFMTSDGDGFVFPGTPASQDGQGFVLATLEDIPNALTESDIAAMGFTKNEGTITEVKMNGVSKGTTGVVDLGDVPTQESVGNLQDHVEDLWSEVGKLTQDKQDALKSGENIKTINGESVVGSGDITITGGSGTITGVSANGTSIATSGVANIPAASTSKYGVTKLTTLTNSSSTTLAATASAVKSAYDLAASKASMSEVNTAIANAITNAINASY